MILPIPINLVLEKDFIREYKLRVNSESDTMMTSETYPWIKYRTGCVEVGDDNYLDYIKNNISNEIERVKAIEEFHKIINKSAKSISDWIYERSQLTLF